MITFMKYRYIYFALSLFFLVPGIISLAMFGLKPSIDFTGGAVLEVAFNDKNDLTGDKVRQKVSTVDDINVSSVQEVTGKNNYLIKLNTIDENKKNEVITKLNELKPDTKEVRFETVGPILGQELIFKTLVAVLLVSLIILSYVAYQFKNKIFGIAAILAMFHDTLIVLGIFSILGKLWGVEVDTLFVTAVLTTLSFSVHDTIVVFDRIREMLNKRQAKSLEDAINKSVNQTLVRSLNNSMTIIFMLTALFLLGGESTRYFVLALLIGTISGTYSSTFTAAPLLLSFTKRADINK